MFFQLKSFNSTLVIPGLFQSENLIQTEGASPLSAWLKTSTVSDAHDSFYQLILQLFGYDNCNAQYNWASLRAPQCICADPIPVNVDIAHVYSLGNTYLDLTLEEAQCYIDYLNPQLPSGLSLQVGDNPLQWHLVTDKNYQFEVCAPDGVFGKTLVDKMPQGPDAGVMLALFNDIQMLLYSSELNQQRRLAGRPTIDALWLWGVGQQIIPSVNCRWDLVISTNDMVLELARLNHVKTLKLTDDVNLSVARGSILIIDDRYQGVAPDWLQSVHVLYPGNGKRYVQKRSLLNLLRQVLLI